MQFMLQSCRLALPIIFFGYGFFGNAYAFFNSDINLSVSTDDVLSGGLTRYIEEQYKKTLPHFDFSFSVIGAARYAALHEVRSGAWVGAKGVLFTSEEMRVGVPDMISTSFVEIEAIEYQLAQRGISLVLLPIAAKIDVMSSFADDDISANTMENIYSMFVQTAISKNILVIDARADLIASALPVFFATDTHWTPHGARITAQAAAKVLPLGALEFGYGAETYKLITGDLIRFVTADRMAPRIGLPQETVVRAPLRARAQPLDIFAQAGVDIALIGTSYSANPDWGFADALMFALRRDVVNFAAVGQGPVQPMRDYLAQPAPSGQNGPRVVLWEFPIRYLTDPALWDDPPHPLPALPAQVVSNG